MRGVFVGLALSIPLWIAIACVVVAARSAAHRGELGISLSAGPR